MLAISLGQKKSYKNCDLKLIIKKFKVALLIIESLGGVHGAMIKSAKKTLRAIFQSADITEKELQWAFIGAETLINSRPLTYQSADSINDVPLTPNHYLIGKLDGTYAPDVIDKTRNNHSLQNVGNACKN